MGMCIDQQLLSSYLDGELKEPFRSQTEEHLAYCPACRARLDKLKELDVRIREASPSDAELSVHKDEVLAALEKKYFSENSSKISFFRRRFELSLPQMVTAAAAVVVVFIGGFVLFGSNSKQTNEILPSYSMQADRENVRFVSNDAQSRQGLDSYSLEEILKYLDSKGYNVDISIKGLTPIETAPEVTQ